MNDICTLYVLGCRGCGEDHNITFKKMNSQVTLNDELEPYTHSGICENTHKTIYAKEQVIIRTEKAQ